MGTFEKDIKKAENLKNQDKIRQQKAVKDKNPKTKIITNPESFAVYNAINPKHVTARWLLIFMVTGAFLFASAIDDLFKNDVLIAACLFALPILWLLYIRVWLLLTYSQFIRWRKNLPYRLTGWEKVVMMSNFTNPEYWSDCKIEISIDQTSDEFEKALEAICYLYCKDANDEMYEGEICSITRKNWSGSKIMRGSINCGVAGDLYEFLKGPLTKLTKHFNNISEVTIVLDGESFKVKQKEMGQTVG